MSLLVLVAFNRKPWNEVACGGLLTSLILLFSLDQHRFQPWAYELSLFCVIWMTCRNDQRSRFMQWLLISIYAYSAVGKLDFEFLHTVGQQMLGVVARAFGTDVNNLPTTTRLGLVATFPLVEFAVAVGLASTLNKPRLRSVAAWSAIALHIGLIFILGPLGLNHRWGVLVWNTQVAIQVYWLFVREQAPAPEIAPWTWRQRLGAAAIASALVLPITERSGLWDHWPSWALYAPHSSRVQVEVTTPVIDRLPATLQPLVNSADTDAGDFKIWHEVPIGAWSLATLDTPIYPQARFQLGVAAHLAALVETDSQVRVVVLGPAARLDGKRRSETFTSQQQLLNASKRYWLNSLPRNRLSKD